MGKFADNLKAIRESRGLTQDDLAAMVKTSKQVLSRYETGQRTPKISMAQKIADALGVQLDELNGTEKPQDNNESEKSVHTEEGELLAMDMDALPPEIRARALDATRRIIHEFADFFNGNQTKD